MRNNTLTINCSQNLPDSQLLMMDSGTDFSYFSSAPMPYPFFGVPPTPQSNTPDASYKNLHVVDEHFDPAFAAFQQDFHYDPSQFVAQPHPAHLDAVSPPLLVSRNSTASMPDQSMDLSQDADLSPAEQQAGHQRSSSEEKDNLTPQQNKRKAQNRAAQRAFRERKEKHVKELEARNTTLQHELITLQQEIERLRREFTRATAENDILRATSGASSNGPTPFLTEHDDLDHVVPGPLGYTPTDFTSKLRTTKDGVMEWSPNSKWAQFGTLQSISVDEENSEPLYTAAQAWDYIQRHELSEKGLVDVGDAVERVKKSARCDGQGGPFFVESDIRKAIKESAVAGGRDELI